MSTMNNHSYNNHLRNGHSGPPPLTMPDNVGILNMEIYFPSQYVDQEDLETFDGVKGKYTKGLMQEKMGFVNDIEDVNSLCMTVVSRLVKKSGISYSDIGRLEVGTETLIDKSKSVKTALIDLFAESGNTDVEGVHSTNACYGGTAALFNCVSWYTESCSYDGRFAIAVCADIAVYSKGPARATGGAGAVAMLIGKDAALVLDRGLRATHVENVYDFYKPNMASEYPEVAGSMSVQCYLRALDKCYQLYCQKAERQKGLNGGELGEVGQKTHCTLDSFDAVIFHSPFSKLVQKSLARLSLNDYVRATKIYGGDVKSKFPSLEKALGPEKLANLALENTYTDRSVMDAFLDLSHETFKSKTEPSLLIAKNVGNMYTPSLYGGLISFVTSLSKEDLAGKHLGLFSYGSGLVASYFSLTVSTNTEPNSPLDTLHRTLSDVRRRLDSRTKQTVESFDSEMERRESYHHAAPYAPKGNPADLFPDTYYLTGIDDKHRRSYALHKPFANGNSAMNGANGTNGANGHVH